MAKQTINETTEPNRLEAAQQELSALQTEREAIPAALRQAAQDADTQAIYRLRKRRAELEQLIPSQQVTVLKLQEEAYKRRSAEADAEMIELNSQAVTAEENARKWQAKANSLRGAQSQAQSIGREYRQYAAQTAAQRSELLRQMQGREVDRALRAPLQNPNYG